MKLDTEHTLKLMKKALKDLFNALPDESRQVRPPKGAHGYRFEEEGVPQAIILKLARVQSALQAAKLLLENGFVQEQAILERAIYEANEDILFLFFSILRRDDPKLKAFWQEEIDEHGNILDLQQEHPPSRGEIRAYIDDSREKLKEEICADINDSILKSIDYIKDSRELYRVCCGYVHGAAPYIMDMYCGNPPYFHTEGMLGTFRIKDHAEVLDRFVYFSLFLHIPAGIICGHVNNELYDYWSDVKKENNLD